MGRPALPSSSVADAPPPEAAEGGRRLVLWLAWGAAAAGIGFVANAVYAGLADLSGFCGVFERSCPAGGQTDSVAAATLVGWGLLVVGALVAWWRRRDRDRALLVAGFSILYVTFLVALWYAAPAIWGPLHCQWPC